MYRLCIRLKTEFFMKRNTAVSINKSNYLEKLLNISGIIILNKVFSINLVRKSQKKHQAIYNNSKTIWQHCCELLTHYKKKNIEKIRGKSNLIRIFFAFIKSITNSLYKIISKLLIWLTKLSKYTLKNLTMFEKNFSN